MNTPLPAEEFVQLFDRLIGLPYRERAEFSHITWRLRSILRRKPRDYDVAVTLLYALRITGALVEAKELSRNIWIARRELSNTAAHNYLANLFGLGLYSEMFEYADEFFSRSSTTPSDTFSNLSHGMLASGKLDIRIRPDSKALEKSLLRDLLRKTRMELDGFLKRLEAENAFEHFSDYMQRVSLVVAQYQCDVCCYPAVYEGPYELSHVIYVEGDKNFRRNLEAEIDAQLVGNMLFEKNFETPMITTIIADIKSHARSSLAAAA